MVHRFKLGQRVWVHVGIVTLRGTIAELDDEFPLFVRVDCDGESSWRHVDTLETASGRVCDCGGAKTTGTHSHWCSVNL